MSASKRRVSCKDEAGNEAIMLYLEQETAIPANTMRVCKVTSRNLHKHEGRLF